MVDVSGGLKDYTSTKFQDFYHTLPLLSDGGNIFLEHFNSEFRNQTKPSRIIKLFYKIVQEHTLYSRLISHLTSKNDMKKIERVPF
jgi:hypothetical protein